MDFLAFYSKYSDNCVALFQEVPLLNDKAICIDSVESRKLIENLPYHVKRVPTLFVTDGINKIIKVLEGNQEIRNWFMLVTYSMSQQPQEGGSAPGGQEGFGNQEFVGDDLLPQEGFTQLDGGEPSYEYPEQQLKKSKTGEIKNLAEELAREREMYIDSSAKMPAGVTRL